MTSQVSTSSSPKRKSGGNSVDRNAVEGQQSERGPTEGQVARRAYELYAERGYVDGYDVQDWLQAERELGLGRYS